jgi:hypothetical protein
MVSGAGDWAMEKGASQGSIMAPKMTMPADFRNLRRAKPFVFIITFLS